MNQLLARADLPWTLIVGRVKLYRKSHDQIGRYRMGLGEKQSPVFLGGPSPRQAAIFYFWAQFSRKLVGLYEYSYLGPVLIMNIHIAHDTKVFVTLRERERKKKAMKYPFPVPSPNLTLTTILSPNHYTTSNFGRPCTQFRLMA